MSKWSVLSLILGGAGLVFSFVSEAAAAKGQKEELLEELEQEYILVRKPQKKEE